MFEQILAIIRNTFFESVRQPILLVLMVVATFALVFSNSLSGYTMEDDNKMMIGLGLSSVFLLGAIAAAFIATNVLNREIENKTALTVISKPVGRPVFVLGKFLGVAGALSLATLYMSFVFMLVSLHGVLQTARDEFHAPVLVFGLGAGLLGVGAAIWANYFYNKVFASAALCLTTPLMGLAYVLALLFDPNFQPQSPAVAFDPGLWLALVLVLIAILVLTSIAIAASTRLGQVMTLSLTLAVFVLGMMSDWLFGRPMHQIEERWLDRGEVAGVVETVTTERLIRLTNGEEQTDELVKRVFTDEASIDDYQRGGESIAHLGYGIAYAVVPNFQVLWLTDAVTQKRVIPTEYVVRAGAYGAFNILTMLGLATILFQRREVG